jgi:hypothetical protein
MIIGTACGFMSPKKDGRAGAGFKSGRRQMPAAQKGYTL